MTERSIALLIYIAINSIQLLKFLRARSTNSHVVQQPMGQQTLFLRVWYERYYL